MAPGQPLEVFIDAFATAAAVLCARLKAGAYTAEDGQHCPLDGDALNALNVRGVTLLQKQLLAQLAF